MYNAGDMRDISKGGAARDKLKFASALGSY
jgi:hypothetical protein